METTNTVASGKLMQDLQAVVGDTEELISATAGDARERAAGARARAQESLREARAHVVALQRDVVARTRAAGQASDRYVHDHPWTSIGLAAGAGLIVGLLMRRGRGTDAH
jgi:ElaB/YqjD/DUF883 family membrane-anchored ribosome-binding protein